MLIIIRWIKVYSKHVGGGEKGGSCSFFSGVDILYLYLVMPFYHVQIVA